MSSHDDTVGSAAPQGTPGSATPPLRPVHDLPAISDLAPDSRFADPERADWRGRDLRAAWTKSLVFLPLLLATEAALFFEMSVRLLGSVMPAYQHSMVLQIMAGVMSLGIGAMGFVVALHGGASSRASKVQARVAFTILLGIAIGILLMRVAHFSRGAVAVSSRLAGTAAASGAADARNTAAWLMSIALLLLFVGTAFHGWGMGRRLQNPALVGMVRAADRRARLREELNRELTVLTGLRHDLGQTEHQIERLPEERATAVREAHAMVVGASDVSRLRLAERLGLPEATSITRYHVDFTPLPHGIQLLPGMPAADAPSDAGSPDATTVDSDPVGAPDPASASTPASGPTPEIRHFDLRSSAPETRPDAPATNGAQHL